MRFSLLPRSSLLCLRIVREDLLRVVGSMVGHENCSNLFQNLEISVAIGFETTNVVFISELLNLSPRRRCINKSVRSSKTNASRNAKSLWCCIIQMFVSNISTFVVTICVSYDTMSPNFLRYRFGVRNVDLAVVHFGCSSSFLNPAGDHRFWEWYLVREIQVWIADD